MKISMEFDSVTDFIKTIKLAYPVISDLEKSSVSNQVAPSATMTPVPVAAQQQLPTAPPVVQNVQTAVPTQTTVAPVAPEQSQTPSMQNATNNPQTQVNNAQPVATSEHTYTTDELAKAAVVLMESGRQAELQSLLASFGVSSLPELPKDKYGAFATALREKGAQI